MYYKDYLITAWCLTEPQRVEFELNKDGSIDEPSYTTTPFVDKVIAYMVDGDGKFKSIEEAKIHIDEILLEEETNE